MILGAPWGLLALLGIPVVLLIHLFRRRFPPRATSALFLWQEPRQHGGAGRRRDHLRQRRSLWAECLAVAAIAWFLSDPHFSADVPARHLVLVLDQHRRLQATAPDGDSALERAQRAATRLVDSLHGHDRVSIIAAADDPRLMAGPAVPPSAARAAIDAWRPVAARSDAAAAWRLAHAVGGEDSLAVWVGDQRPPDWPQRSGCLAVGRPAANVGILSARRVIADGQQRVALRVLAADSGTPVGVILTGQHRGAASQSRATLPPQGKDRVRQGVFPVPAAIEASEALSIRLDTATASGGDALIVDNAIQLLPESPRAVRLWIDPDLSDAQLWQRAAQAAGAESAVDSASAHLVITADAAPADSGRWALVIAAGEAPTTMGPFPTRGGHPLLEGVDTTGLIWSGGTRSVDDPADVVMQAGDAALLQVARRGRQRIVRIAIDPAASNWDRHPALPALMANLVSWRRSHLAGAEQVNLALASPARVVLPPGQLQVSLEAPNQEPVILLADPDGVVAIDRLQHPGDWVWFLDGEEWLRQRVHPHRLATSDLARTDTVMAMPDTWNQGLVERRRGMVGWLLPILVALLAAGAAVYWFRREMGSVGQQRGAAT